MKKYEIEPEGKSPKNLRMTGRDGPPGLQMQIRGAPFWLATVAPVTCIIRAMHKQGQWIARIRSTLMQVSYNN